MIEAYHFPFVIGMDGGGTKTSVCVMNMTGQVVDSLSGNSMNVNSLGCDCMLENLAQIFADLKGRGADWSLLQGICIGVAGVSNPVTRDTIVQGIRSAGITVEPEIIGDHQAALYGAHGRGKGMILISGTGSICYGMDGTGHEARSGGWGHLIDDEGSGYALGRDVLSAVVQAEDGRVSPTCMRSAVFEYLNISSVQELIGFVYNPAIGKKEIAALAPIVLTGIAAGEDAACAILLKAAENLTDMVSAVANKLELQRDALAFCGSVISNNIPLIEMLKKRINERYPMMRCIRPAHDAAYGAALRSLEMLK